MYLERFYDETLAQASWMVGCQANGTAIVIDPNRDAEAYESAAEAQGLRITLVAETHVHADFVSGTRELAARTGATMLLSGEGGEEWSYRFGGDGVRLLRGGDVFELGNIRFRVLHTPGHTPEHLCFLVTDGAASDEPIGIFTGDFVFVGDVGRPDLLERAAGASGTMEPAARRLWASLQAFRALPDHLQIWPGHGAGSACGKALGAVPQSTVGYEKRVGWAFRAPDEDAFVRDVLSDQPEAPRYFAVMKRVNRDGPALLGGLPRPPRTPPARIEAALAQGATVMDVRAREAFQGGHLPGALNLPLRYSFTQWAGSLLPYGEDLYLIAAGEADAVAAARLLALIGLERVVGWTEATAAHEAWREAGRALASAAVVEPPEAERRRAAGQAAVLDVRRRTEWDEGHLPGAVHVHLGSLQERLGEVPRDRPLLVYCRTGARSAIAQSLLLRAGFEDVINIEGGWSAWERAGLPAVRPAAAAAD